MINKYLNDFSYVILSESVDETYNLERTGYSALNKTPGITLRDDTIMYAALYHPTGTSPTIIESITVSILSNILIKMTVRLNGIAAIIERFQKVKSTSNSGFVNFLAITSELNTMSTIPPMRYAETTWIKSYPNNKSVSPVETIMICRTIVKRESYSIFSKAWNIALNN